MDTEMDTDMDMDMNTDMDTDITTQSWFPPVDMAALMKKLRALKVLQFLHKKISVKAECRSLFLSTDSIYNYKNIVLPLHLHFKTKNMH
jgi:hypothetical protein